MARIVLLILVAFLAREIKHFSSVFVTASKCRDRTSDHIYTDRKVENGSSSFLSPLTEEYERSCYWV